MASKVLVGLAAICVLFVAVSAYTQSVGTVGRRTYYGTHYNPVTHSGAKSFCQARGMRLPTIANAAEKAFFVGMIDIQMMNMMAPGQERVPAFWTSAAPKGQTCQYMYYTRTNVGFAYQSCNARVPAPLCEKYV